MYFLLSYELNTSRKYLRLFIYIYKIFSNSKILASL